MERQWTTGGKAVRGNLLRADLSGRSPRSVRGPAPKGRPQAFRTVRSATDRTRSLSRSPPRCGAEPDEVRSPAVFPTVMQMIADLLRAMIPLDGRRMARRSTRTGRPRTRIVVVPPQAGRRDPRVEGAFPDIRVRWLRVRREDRIVLNLRVVLEEDAEIRHPDAPRVARPPYSGPRRRDASRRSATVRSGRSEQIEPPCRTSVRVGTERHTIRRVLDEVGARKPLRRQACP